MNKFITQVTPSSNKVKKLGFLSQNQVKPITSNTYVFTISASICTIFGTIKRCDILNIPVIRQFLQSSSAQHITLKTELPLSIH